MNSSEGIIIHLWCAPRVLSTAVMYSFSQRSDTFVLDEPLYAHYLFQNPDLYRPYREELINSCETDGNKVLRDMDTVSEKRIIVAKHMTKFIVNLDKSLIVREESDKGRKVKHVFLMRDPLDMIASWNAKVDVHREECSLHGTDFPEMLNLYSELKNRNLNPLVIDSNLLREHPREILSELCSQLGIPFDNRQLSWAAGPKPTIDG